MSFSKRVEHYDSDEEECGDHYEHIYEEITPKRPNKIHQQYYSESEDDMYSDCSSSTTSSESDENFPGYIPVPMSEYDDMLPGDKTKLYQAYRGQLKLSAYINYGLLTVHVVMGRHLKSKFKSNCDSYIKLSLVPDDTQRTRCKTEVILDTNNPLYDEKFSFELLDEDSPKRLLVSVWNRDTRRNQCEFIGCMSFGVHSIQTQQKVIQGWYYLLNGDLGRNKHLQVTDKKHLSERSSKNIPAVNQDVMWMEPCVMIIKRGKSGFGFTINGSCPVTVCRVDPGSSGDVAGVKTGDCIVRIDGLNVSRSACDSVARIIRHCQKKLVLEVQRPKKVEKTFHLENLDRSPRQPLCSSTPSANEKLGDLIMSPWKPPSRRQLEPVIEELTPPPSPESPRFHTQDYGWIDNGRYNNDEDIYVEPEELRKEVMGIPRDPDQPPKLPPPNRPGRKIEDMAVSPWKPPGHPGARYEDEDTYMCLDGLRYKDNESRYEWDYSDTRLGENDTRLADSDTKLDYSDTKLGDYHNDTPEWTDQRWSNKPPSGSSSGYSSSTLPRSMKFGKKTSSSRLTDSSGYHATKGYHDDISYRSNTGLGAHGDHGKPRVPHHDAREREQYDDYGYIDRPTKQVDNQNIYLTATNRNGDERTRYNTESNRHGNTRQQYITGSSRHGDERQQYLTGSSRHSDERQQYITGSSRHSDERQQYITGRHSDERKQYLTGSSRHSDEITQYSTNSSRHSDDRTQYSTASSSMYSGSSSGMTQRRKKVSFNVNRHSAV